MTESAGTKKNEDWFLDHIELEQIDVPAVMTWLRETRTAEGTEKADSYAELLQETLMEKGRSEEALETLELRAAWRGHDAAFRGRFADEVRRCLGHGPEVRAIIESIGLDSALPMSDCISRLDVLRGLKPEVLCFDATWGGGVVQHVDWFYRRVTIDFEKKKAHEMSFDYAAGTLKVLNEDHLYYRYFKDREGLNELVRTDPAEVVRIVLRGFGPLAVDRIQAELIPRVFPESHWKPFWEIARRDLKKDPLVEIPVRRSEPIRLLARPQGYDAAWFQRLAGERRMAEILQRSEAYKRDEGTENMDDAARDIMLDRLAFVVRGAGYKHPGLAARAAMTAIEFGLSNDSLDPRALLSGMLEVNRLLSVLSDIPARDIRRLLNHLGQIDRDGLHRVLIEALTRLNLSSLTEAMDVLLTQGREADCAKIFKELAEHQEMDVEFLNWLFRNPAYLDQWRLGNAPDLARWSMRALELEHVGEKLRTQNQLRKRFENRAWLQQTLEAMDDAERRELARSIRESTSWETLEKRSLMGALVKRYPELEEVISSRDAASRSSGPKKRFTSYRSYAERQRQLHQIVSVDIPAVAKEIGIARAYGDLRENFEYKAAKDKQALLMRRQGEFQQMLNEVQASNFEDFPHDRVGMGTGVRLVFDDGHEEVHYILGVWDRDEELDIISSESRLAQVLEGKHAGDRVEVPSSEGDQICLLREVTPLPERIMQWIEERETSQTGNQ